MILFVSYSGGLGGAERVLLDHVTRLDRPLKVACPAGPLAVALRAAGVEHVPLPTRPVALGLRHAAALAALARDIRSVPADGIVAWGARAILATALTQRPWLAVHHDLLDQPVRAAVSAAAARATRVLSASHAIAAQFGGDVLHPGVDLDRFTPQPRPAGPPRALVLGALVGWKRPHFALDVAERIPELELTLAGAPLTPGGAKLESGLRARAAAPPLAGRIHVGPTSDVPRALAAAHVLLHCADREPYGMALVEALAAGRPVVAANGGGPREIVTPAVGCLYPPGDADAAARALREALADPGLRAAARRRAEECFDIRASVQRLRAALP